ncbi:MAG: carbohydrate ABC transporter permease [Bacteroidales bacterium]
MGTLLMRAQISQNDSFRHIGAVAQRWVGQFFTHAVLLLASVVIGLPFFWMITTSLKSDIEVGLFPPVWIPSTLQWTNFVEVWNSAPFGSFYINSLATTISGLILEVVIASLSAYAFARIDFPNRDKWFVVVLATMMVPSEIALVPNYLTIRNLGWINSYPGIVIPYVSSAFGCFFAAPGLFRHPARSVRRGEN